VMSHRPVLGDRCNFPLYSGSGKSTVVQLIERYFNPLSGLQVD
jgi:ABC-type transport system involved in cytochrome bd biosynthesis fused ATPase/permease subunit